MASLPLKKLTWSEFQYLLTFLTPKEQQQLGSTCRNAFVHIVIRNRTIKEGLSLTGYNALDNCCSLLPNHYRRDRAMLISYPRCGNSYLRQLLESETGILTGSDSRTNRPLTKQLIQSGYLGEGIVDSSVWVVKTHFPERLGYVTVKSKKLLLLTRNVFDVLESYFHMNMTNSHHKQLTDEVFQQQQELWLECARHEATIWNAFYNYWLALASTTATTGLSLLIVRHEDLVANPALEMTRILQFLDSPPEQTTTTTTTTGNNKAVKTVATTAVGAGSAPFRWKSFRRSSAEKRGSLCLVNDEDLSFHSNSHASNKVKSIGDNNSNNSNKAERTNVKATAGYRPKKGGPGKGLRLLPTSILKEIAAATASVRDAFGYQLTPLDNNDNNSENYDNISGDKTYKLTILPRDESKYANYVPSSSGSGSGNDKKGSECAKVDEDGYVWFNQDVNDVVRRDDDKFGRLFGVIRCQLTDDDKQPLPTIS